MILWNNSGKKSEYQMGFRIILKSHILH